MKIFIAYTITHEAIASNSRNGYMYYSTMLETNIIIMMLFDVRNPSINLVCLF